MPQEKILKRLRSLGIPELADVTELNLLDGSYINLDCTLPNKTQGKILDDSKKYLACQVEIDGSERCYGIAADETQLAVYEYGCEGADAVLVIWAKL